MTSCENPKQTEYTISKARLEFNMNSFSFSRNGICCYKATVEELLKPFTLNSAKEDHPAICIKQLMSEIEKMENKVSNAKISS